MFIRALKRLLGRDAYVQVFKNRIWVRNLDNGQTLDEAALQPFSTTRLLVGDFEAAQRHLTGLFHRLYSKRIITPSPRVLIQAREQNEGGLSLVEKRVLLELATVAGASDAFLHEGSELSDFAARELLANRGRDA